MRNGCFPTPLLDYKERGVAVELVGTEKIADRDAYVLVFKPKTGPSSKNYTDTTTFMMLRQVVTMDVPPVGPFEQITDYSDEKEVDGVKIAYKVVSSSSLQNLTVTISKVEHNGALDRTLFVKPSN